jgi:hypothetical protein
MRRQPIPFWKASATVGGGALAGTAVWLNAEHVAASEGWFSPLVLAGIFVTLCAAATPPLAERATKTGQPAKAVVLWLFFALAVSFSLTASITRSGGYQDTHIAEAERGNITARLANDAYAIAVANRSAECASGRGPKCREAETHLSQARNALRLTAPIRAADPAAERVLPCSASARPQWPLQSSRPATRIGTWWFIFLATGLSPGTNEQAIKAKPAKRKAKARSPRKRTIGSRKAWKSDVV